MDHLPRPSFAQDADYTLYRIEKPELWKLGGHKGQVRAVESISDLGFAASGGDDGLARLSLLRPIAWDRQYAIGISQ